MSCYMMRAEGLSAIAVYTAQRANTRIYNGPIPGQEVTSLLHRNECGHYQAEEIYRKLVTMNLAAYEARYGDTDVEDVEKYMQMFDLHKGWNERPVKIGKLIGCWLYQCAEGRVWEEPFYEAMEDWQNAIYRYIVESSDEWQNA